MALEKVGVEFIAENLDRFLGDLNKANRAMADFGAEAMRLGQLDGHLGGLSGQMTGLGESAHRAGGGFSSFREIAVGALREVGVLATQAFVELGKAVVDFGADSVMVAAEFEGSLNLFEAATGSALAASGKDIEDFSALFLDLGASSQFSALEASAAASELAKGGVDVAEIYGGALEATLNLAAAGELELAPAAEIVANQLSIWADQGVDATEVSDLLAQSAGASTADVEGLGLALAASGSTAKAAGVDFDELVTALSVTRSAYGSTVETGTGMKNFLVRLQPTTADATAAMQQLGLYTEETGSAFYDANGQFVGMERASGLLYEATKDLSEEQKVLALQTIFGNDAMNTAVGLAAAGEVGYLDMVKALEAAGTAAKIAEEKNKGFLKALDALDGATESLQIVFATELLPVLTEFIEDYMIPGVNAVRGFSEALFAADDPLVFLGDAFDAAGQQAEAWIMGALPAVQDGLMRMGLALGAWVTEQAPLWEASLANMGVEAGRWVLDAIPAAVANLGQLGQSLHGWALEQLPSWKESMTRLAVVGGAWALDAIPALVSSLGTYREQLLTWAGQSLPGWIGVLGDFVTAAGDWILDAVPGLLTGLGDYYKFMISWVFDNAPAWADALLAFADKIVGWVGDALPVLADNLGQFFNGMVNWIVDSLPEWAQTLALLAGKAAQWALDAIPPLLGNLALMGGELLGWIAQTAVDIVPPLLSMAGEFFHWIAKDVIPALPGELEKIWQSLTTWFTETKPMAAAKLAEMGKEFWEWVTDPGGPVQEIGPALQKFSVAVVEVLISLAELALNAAFDIGVAILDGIASGLANLGSMLADTLTAPVEGAYNGLRDLLGINSPSTLFMRGIGIPIGQGVVVGVEQALDGLEAMMAARVTAAATAAQSAAGTFLDVGQTLGSAMAGGMLATIGEAASGVASQVATITGGAGTSSASAIYGSIGGIGRTIAPPAGAGQIAHMGTMQSITNIFNAPQYAYSPTYGGAPRQPSQDFTLMKTFAGA